jgi:20S proteasome alpha/beta subunit
MKYYISKHARRPGQCTRVVERRVSSSLKTTTMETSFAITGKGYLIMAADTTAARSIVKMKIDEDKIKTLSPHLLMAYSGEPGTFIF